MVGNEKKSTSTAYPITNRVSFLFSKSGTVGSFFIRVFGAERVCDDQDLKGRQRRFGERFAINNNLITIAEDQIGERLVAPRGSMKIVMGLVEKYPGIILGVGGMFDARVEMWIGNLLGVVLRRLVR